jgi:DNA-binding NtrC family response regulator/ligand-binding sensor domain-containing protein
MSTLARLAFRVPPERMDTFEAAYQKKLLPILRRHDLEESAEGGRRTVEGVFSRLFEVTTPSQVAVEEIALQTDAAWQEVLRDLGTSVGPTQPDGLLGTYFGLYRTPAGPGKTVAAGPGSRQGVWQTFEVADGLPSPHILDIVQDRAGDLWFGTAHGGVSRYDGVQFVTFTTEDGLAHNDVRSIFEDRDGALWFGTRGGGVSRYEGKEFATFTTEDGLAHNVVRSISEDRDGALWFGTLGGVSRYDVHRPEGEQFTTFTTEDGLASDSVISILGDREGHLWFGTFRGRGASRYDVHRPEGEQFVTFTTEDGLAGNNVWGIVEDRDGVLWFATEGSGVSRYDARCAEGEQFVTFTTEDGLASNNVCPILEDREGNLWFGTYEDGVSRYDARCADGVQFVTFTPEDGLAGNWVQSILEDREGDLWFATSGGVSRYDGAKLFNLTTEDGLANNRVMSALEDRGGNLWFGTEGGGVSRYDGTKFTTFTAPTEDFLPLMAAQSILEDRVGHLWFGSVWGGGVKRYDGKEFVTFTTENGLAADRVQSIVEDRKGHLWFGTSGGGVSRYDGHRPDGEQFVTFTTENGLAANSVQSIVEDREGHLWFGTSGGGVSRYDGHRPDGEQFATFTTRDGLAHNDVRSIFEDREGHLWFGTGGGGVSRYDGKEFVSFTVEDGLAYNIVTCIFQDSEGILWFGTWGRGIDRYDGLMFQNLAKGDGLLSNTVQQILEDRNGELWIATEGGITRYRPRRIPPSIRLIDVVADRRYAPAGEIRIPSSQELTIFEFQGRSFTTRRDGMAYLVRLEGYDPDWKPNYTGRVEYHDLPLGDYTFQVKAVDRDLNYSEPAALPITIEADPRLEALTQALSAGDPSERFVGESPALRRVEEDMAKIAPTDLTVLILGETGTGKGLAARAVHGSSPRKQEPFIPVNCGAIPEGLVESELFGHEKGAFTGATARKLGQIEVAEGGTLFLDEIGDLAPQAQAKLLQFLQDRTFQRVGGTKILQVDVRVVAATNRDLVQMVGAGRFREDLYFRLQEFTVALPPLQARRGDIRLLAEYFMERMAAHLHREVTRLSPAALAALEGYDWPGNVRELEHAVKRAVVVCPGTTIRAEDISLELGTRAEGTPKEELTLEEVERRHIREVLEQTGGVVKGPRGAATRLGLKESTLRSRMKKLGIRRP